MNIGPEIVCTGLIEDRPFEAEFEELLLMGSKPDAVRRTVRGSIRRYSDGSVRMDWDIESTGHPRLSFYAVADAEDRSMRTGNSVTGRIHVEELGVVATEPGSWLYPENVQIASAATPCPGFPELSCRWVVGPIALCEGCTIEAWLCDEIRQVVWEKLHGPGILREYRLLSISRSEPAPELLQIGRR